MLKGFQKFFANQRAAARAEMSLGNPLRDDDAIQRRLSNMATLTGGRGFLVPAKDRGAKSARRKEQKAADRKKSRERYLAIRANGIDPKYMHAAARRGLFILWAAE